jgi:hypothetical protein
MTGETSGGARRVRVVPRGERGSTPEAGGPPPAGPVDADTEVLPRVGAGPRPAAAPRPTPPPPSPTPPAADAEPGSSAVVREVRRRRGAADDAAAENAEASEPTERRVGMGAPALVLGVLAAGTCWTGWAGVVLGLFGAVAGYLGTRRAWKGLASDGAASLGGLTLGVVGLVVGVVVVWPTLFGTGNFGDGLTLDQCLQQANGAFQMHLCKSQHITEFNQRFPDNAT